MRELQAGRFAIVNPRLTKDPYNLRGRRVYIVSIRKGIATVNAPGINKAKYDLDALITIREYKRGRY